MPLRKQATWIQNTVRSFADEGYLTVAFIHWFSVFTSASHSPIVLKWLPLWAKNRKRPTAKNSLDDEISIEIFWEKKSLKNRGLNFLLDKKIVIFFLPAKIRSKNSGRLTNQVSARTEDVDRDVVGDEGGEVLAVALQAVAVGHVPSDQLRPVRCYAWKFNFF